MCKYFDFLLLTAVKPAKLSLLNHHFMQKAACAPYSGLTGSVTLNVRPSLPSNKKVRPCTLKIDDVCIITCLSFFFH